MDKIQYSVFRRDTRSAAGKAKWDASDILLQMGFRELYRPSSMRAIRVAQQLVGTLGVSKDALLAVQYPANLDVYYRILARKGLRSFALLHDVESLRRQTDVGKDVGVLSGFDCVISHNASMTKALRDAEYRGGVVELGLFDYLGFGGPVSGERDRSTVAFAGNLSKAGFLEKVPMTGLRMNLYGLPEPSRGNLGDNVRYMGSFPSNDIPGRIAGGWGLVWDGDSVDTCSGHTGNYLRYNSPHKASMYIVAERPLVVWEESAIAPLVVERGLGIAVGSLGEAAERIATIGPAEYESLLHEVRKEKEELCNGSHLRHAVNGALELIAQSQLREKRA